MQSAFPDALASWGIYLVHEVFSKYMVLDYLSVWFVYHKTTGWLVPQNTLKVLRLYILIFVVIVNLTHFRVNGKRVSTRMWSCQYSIYTTGLAEEEGLITR